MTFHNDVHLLSLLQLCFIIFLLSCQPTTTEQGMFFFTGKIFSCCSMTSTRIKRLSGSTWNGQWIFHIFGLHCFSLYMLFCTLKAITFTEDWRQDTYIQFYRFSQQIHIEEGSLFVFHTHLYWVWWTHQDMFFRYLRWAISYSQTIRTKIYA
jgi:hypothetical protein